MNRKNGGVAWLACQLALLGACAAVPVESPTVPPTTSTAQPTDAPTNQPTPNETAEPTDVPATSPPPSASATPAPTPDEGAIPIAPAGELGFLLAGDDAMWAVGDVGSTRSIFKVDPDSNAVDAVVEGLPRLPNPIAGQAVNGSLWVGSWDRGSVTQYDATTGDQLAEHPIGLHPIEPVYAFNDIWFLNHDGGTVSRIDTRAGEVAATVELGPGAEPRNAVAGGGLLWLVGLTSTIWGIDPATNEIAREIDTDISCLVGLAYLVDRLMVESCDEPGIHQFDPETGESYGSLAAPIVLAGQLEVDGRLWLPRRADGDYIERLVALDAETLEIADEFVLPGRFTAASFAQAFDSYWIAGREGAIRVPAEALREP